MPRVAFIAPIVAMNTGSYRQQVRNLATGIYSHINGRDQNGAVTTDMDAVEKMTLKGFPDIEVHIWVGWHPNVALNVRQQYSDLQFAALHQIAFFPPPDPMTEAFMLQRLEQKAYQHGCAGRWVVRPGDNLGVADDVARLAKFVAF